MTKDTLCQVACVSEHKESPLCDKCIRNADMIDIQRYEHLENYKPNEGKCDNFLKEPTFKIVAKAK